MISTEEKSKIMQDEGKDKKWEVKNCASWKAILKKYAYCPRYVYFLENALRDEIFSFKESMITFPFK